MGPRLLVVAGHDPSGGAGIEADRDALRELPVVADFVVTAHTDQDDAGVRAVGAVASAEWSASAREFLKGARAVKFGLLPGLEHVRAAAAIARDTPAPVVIDPVIAATSGARFLDARAVAAVRDELLPAGVVLTPNLDEAAELTRIPRAALEGEPARVDAAYALLERGARAVLLKGGHATGTTVRDLLLEVGCKPLWLEHPRYTGAVRGTGCRLATALAAWLALDASPALAARHATDLVAGHIRDVAAD